MFSWLWRLLGQRTPPSHVRGWRSVRARYDAAQTTDENRRHWAAADGLSPISANSPEVRRLLRNRARYEVANNSYARGIVRTLANDVIGTGPRLQMLTANPEANRRIEQAFLAWSKAIGLAAKLRTARMARCVDGEAVALLTTNPKLPTPVQLDLRLVEADQLATPDLFAPTTNAVDGIVFDTHGNPTEYHLLRHHPGETVSMVGWSLEYDRYPASAVRHWFLSERPGQVRGVPEILSALPLFAQLRRYTLAVIAAAETAADFAGILYTDAPAGGESDEADPWESIELERRALVTVPSGWKMGQLDAKQPTTTYGEFKREILKEIARCLNMPYNVAAGDSSGYNYSSGRLDHQVYDLSIRVDRHHCEQVVLDPTLSAFFDEAALIPGLLPAGIGPIASWPHQWFWDGRDHVDPAKEASAQETRLRNHTTTLAAEYARKGLDWEEQIQQRAKELERMRELGLSVSTDQQPTPEPVDQEDMNQ